VLHFSGKDFSRAMNAAIIRFSSKLRFSHKNTSIIIRRKSAQPEPAAAFPLPKNVAFGKFSAKVCVSGSGKWNIS
jgi:hypothetical protein